MQWVPLMKRIIQLEAGTKLKQMLTIYLSWQRVVSAPDAWWGLCSMWKPAACGFMATLMRYVSVYQRACLLFVYPCPALATPRSAPRSCPTHISAAHLVICSSAVWTCDTRHATGDTRDTQLSHLVSRVSHRTSNTLNIQLFSHLFQIYNCFLCSHTHMDTHRLKLAFGTWLVLCSVKYYRLECRVESFNWRKERKFLDGFQVLELGTPLVCCVF